MAVLLKHHDLGHAALGLVEHGLPEVGRRHGLPRSIAEACKVVYQAKKILIKVREGKEEWSCVTGHTRTKCLPPPKKKQQTKQPCLVFELLKENYIPHLLSAGSPGYVPLLQGSLCPCH